MALEITSSDLSGHVQVAVTVAPGLGFELLSPPEFSAGLRDWRVLRSGQSLGALCHVLERFLRGICGVAKHRDCSVPSRRRDLDQQIVVVRVVCQCF